MHKVSIKSIREFIQKYWMIIVFLAITGGISLLCLPYLLELRDPVGQQKLQNWIASKGNAGWLILLAIQILQIVIALIPGEPIEVVAGLLYGTIGGLVICEIGILIGSALVYFGVRRYGITFIRTFVHERDINKFTFLQDSRKVETIVFLLFLLPGTPKDALTYLAPLSKLSPGRFFLIATFARIPSVVTSTLAGNTLADGNLWAGALIFLVIGLIGLCGIYFQKVYLERLERLRKKRMDRIASSLQKHPPTPENKDE